MKTLLLLTLLAGSAGLALATDAPPILPLWPQGAPGSEARRNEPEKITGGNVSNIHQPTLTVYLPTKEKATGVGIVVCPGGGHRFLVVKKEGTDIAGWLVEHGIAAFVLKNRLARDDANPPGQPQPYTIDRDERMDAQRALRLVRSHANEWALNPAAIGIMGFSAGGEVSAVTAMLPGTGDAHAADPIDRLDGHPDFQVLVYPGQSQRIEPHKGAPPAFLCAGTEDRPDISEGVAKAYLRFKAAGVPVELHLYAGVGHGFALRPGPAAGWADALRAWLVNEKFIAATTALTR